MIFSTSLGESRLQVLFFYFHTGACFDMTMKPKIFQFEGNFDLSFTFFLTMIMCDTFVAKKILILFAQNKKDPASQNENLLISCLKS